MEVAFSIVAILLRLIGSATVYLFVDKWRATMPLHMLTCLLIIAGLLNWTPWFAEAWTGVLFVLLLAGITSAVVYRTAPRWENQLFGHAVSVVGSAWLLLGYFHLLSGTHLFQMLMVMALVFTGLWAWDRRVDHRVKVDKKTKSFEMNPVRQDRAKLKDATCMEHEDLPGIGWREVWTWPGASNIVSDIIKNIRLIEAEFGEAENTLVAERVSIPTQPGRFYSNRIEFRCIRDNPLAHVSEFNGRAVAKLDEVVTLGQFADARPITFQLWQHGVGGFHLLAAGAARSGKSSLMQLMILLYGPHPFVRMVGSDLKGGAAFLPFAPLFTWLATDLDSSLMLLELLNLECDRRGHIAAANAWEDGVWQPSEDHPVILAFFDEIASLTGKGVPKEWRLRALFLFSEIARKGPGLGIEMRIATQEPTLDALGTTQFITQLEWRAAFRLNLPNRAQYCIPGLAGQVDPYNINREQRGTCYVDAGGQRRAMEARMKRVKTATITRQVDAAWAANNYQPRTIPGFDSAELPPGVTLTGERHQRALEAYASRKMFTPEMVRGTSAEDEVLPGGDDGSLEAVDAPSVPAVEAVPEDRRELPEAPTGDSWEELNAAALEWPKNSKEAASFILRAVEAYLRAWPGGVPRSQIAKKLDRSSSSISAKLEQLASEHRAHSVDGRWFPGPADEDPDDDEDEPEDE